MHNARMKHALGIAALTLCLSLPMPELAPTAYAKVDVWDGTLIRPALGKGTKEDPYIIKNSEEFAYLLQNYDNNSGVCNHKYYRLTADLDLNHNMWRYGVATTDNRTFRAHFDGGGHKIYNVDLYVYHNPQEVHAALFPQLGGDPDFESVIENLEVEDVTLHFFDRSPNVTPCHSFAISALVGQMYANSRIENCIVSNMRNAPLHASVEVPDNASYRIAPLVGDIQEKFGEHAQNADVASARIIHSYGKFVPSLGGLHANPGNSLIVKQEQGNVEDGEYKGYTWHKLSDGAYSFTTSAVKIRETGINDKGNRTYHAVPTTPGTYTYRWVFNNNVLPTDGPDCEIPIIGNAYTLSVEMFDAKGKLVTSNGNMITPPAMELHTTSITSVGKGLSYNIKTDVRGENIASLANELTYEWFDLNDNENVVGRGSILVGAKSDHTYLCLARLPKNPSFAISTICKVGKPIYVNLNGITSAEDIATYTFDGVTAYPVGDDSNDGSTPETAVRTLQRAIDLLPSVKEGGEMASNLIVIMGDYSDNVLASYLDQKGTVANPQALDYQGKPLLICGSYGNIRKGRILATGESIQIENDIRFENLCFHGQTQTADACVIYAQNHNVTFGYGLSMDHYANMLDSRGLTHGAQAPMFSVFGGFLNPDFVEFDYQPCTLRVLSGYYGRLIAGSRFTHLCYNSGNIAGTPRHPQNTSIIVEAHNPINASYNPFDVGLILGGQTDGSCYSCSNITVKGNSRVGRILGGSIGYGRAAYVRDRNGNLSPRPSDSFYGKTVINIESGTINEIYGTSMGGNDYADNITGTTFVDSCTTYFYGISEINISGGEIANTIYGAGAGAVTGMMLNERQHTFDPLIPHALSNGQIAYGPWEKANGNIPNMIAPDGSTLHIYDCLSTINISGSARLRGSVYGGGNGYCSTLMTRMATSQSGNLFGHTNINITGGHIEGYVYGGGRGSLTYYDNHDLSGYPTIEGKQREAKYFDAIAQVYGDTHVTIKGGTVDGMVFGAGEGTYYRPISATNPKNATTYVAAVYGNTYVTIDSVANVRDYVFGAGNYADVLTSPDRTKPTGSCYVTISGGSIGNSIYGGGHGHFDAQHDYLSVTADISRDTHVTVTGGEFAYIGQPSRYSDKRYYNVLGSGRTASIVHGDTYVDMRHSLLSQAMLDSIGMHHWTDGKPWDRSFCIAGGGFGDKTDVKGNTHILIDIDGLTDAQKQHFQNLCQEEMHGFENMPGITFTDVFGGGLKGDVYGSTDITIQGQPIIRNIYGGSLQGHCGLNDHGLNGSSIYAHSTAKRDYTTHASIRLRSGRVMRVYGGSLMGNICGETEVNIGTLGDTLTNRQLVIDHVYGGNDLTGSIAGSNNPLYGSHVNVCGGVILGNLFGSGDGTDISQKNFVRLAGQQPDKRPYLRERPHVASTKISIIGGSEDDMVRIGKVFVGGNNTTVGLFDRDSLERSDLGMFREVLRPNTGRAAINIGSNVSIGELYMGCCGDSLFHRGATYSTTDGKTWYQGFINDEDFHHYCRHVDMSCVPTLTFNADGLFHNDHPIDDRMGDILEFETPGEMDASNVILGSFSGGGHRGSMTSDSCYIYTLPTGVTVTRQIVGGSFNAHFDYTEKKGLAAGTKRSHIGGIAPYHDDFIRTDRVQLNIFNKFADATYRLDKNGNPSHAGAKVFGGCLDYGIIMGYVSLNYHSDILGDYQLRPGESWESISKEWNSEVGYIYAAGKGESTEVLGATYINIRGAVFNGQKCIPNCLNVFGGGLAGRVIGRTNVSVDIQCKGSSAKEAQTHAVWGKVYGGGRMGDVCMQSQLMPSYRSPRTAETHVRIYSGYVGEVFGGARMADIENGTWVEINDRSTEHFHTMIGRVFGGSDLSGKIGSSPQISKIRQDTIRTNTYVSITERQHTDGTYSGFPLIGNVFGGGNGEYGLRGGDDHYVGGEISGRNGNISLAGMELPNVDSVWVEITGGTIMEAYGGANCSNVKKLAHIAVDYADNMDSKAHFDRTASEQCYKRGKTFITEPYIKDAFTDDGVKIGLTHNICRLYGGNNSAPLLIQPEWDLQRAEIGTIYGGCNKGDVLYYNEAGDMQVHPGVQGDPSLWIVLWNDNLHIDNVFGGSRMGNIRPSRITFNEKTQHNDTIPVTFGENQYGSKILVCAGTYGRIFGGNDVSGSVLNGTHIMINGGQVDEVYGAGNGYYTYKWDPSITQITEKWDNELHDYVYHVPAVDYFGGKNATDIQKVLSINEHRPNVTKSCVEINGLPDNLAVVTKGVFSGGYCSTVVGPNYSSGFIKMELGDYIILNNVYLGSNGEEYVGDYINHLLSYNGITNYDQRDDNYEGITMLDAIMAPVAIYGLPKDFHFHNQYNHGYIGSFFIGGRRGSLIADGQLDVSFPLTLKFYDKIVGGPDQAEVQFVDPMGHKLTYAGGIRWNHKGSLPNINLNISSEFVNARFDATDCHRYYPNYLRFSDDQVDDPSVRVYSGCYKSGQVEGNINIEMNGIGEEEEIFF